MKKWIAAGWIAGLAFAAAAQEPGATDPSGEAEAAPAPAEETAAETAKPSFFREMAIQYTDEGEYEEAERAYLHAIKDDPENVDIRFRLGTLYLMMQRYSEAEPILRKLAEEYPDNAAVQNNLSWIYATGGRMRNSAKAMRHAREALLVQPHAPSLWDTLAEGYYSAGDYEKALRAARHAMDLLAERGAGEEETRPYAEKIIKYQRAQEAFRRFEGTDLD